MKLSPSTVITTVAVLLIVAAVPSVVREFTETGRIYLFSAQFLEDLPRRLTGPGRLRFIIQPLVAILLGFRSGKADAKAGRPPYLLGLFFHAQHRKELLRSGMAAIRNLVSMSIIADAVSQFLIYRQVHPGAALVVGPVLICAPYALSRAATTRLVRTFGKASP